MKMSKDRSENRTPRAKRFGARLKGDETPTFAQIMRQHKIDEATVSTRSKVAPVLSLLCAREAIDKELSGRKLSALAAEIGDDLFDAVCDCEIPTVDPDFAHLDLPGTDTLHSQGELLLSQVGLHPQLARLAELANEIVENASTSRGTP